MILNNCKFCGKKFKVDGSHRIYDTIDCYRKDHSKIQTERRKRTHKYFNKDLCLNCGGMKLKTSKVCWKCNSKKFKKNSSILLDKSCEYCKGWFVTENKRRMYCSNDCKNKSVRVSHMNGRKRKYGRDGGFVKSDGVVLHADNCLMCGFDRFVEYHHVAVRQVVALCPNHHRLLHRNVLTKEEGEKLFNFKQVQGELFDELEGQASASA